MAGAAVASQVAATINGVQVSQRLYRKRIRRVVLTWIANSASNRPNAVLRGKVGHGKLNRESKGEGYQKH